ncbi:hypothetical protein F5146DRAFT_1136762 [Armillaria mellea]|nr:hypothetical protein F5146DRAFT_1136762 [Armillaria mellea]
MILRSVPHPLDIVFEVWRSRNEDLAIEAFPLVLEESYRWKSMELNLPLPMLEQLKAAHGKIPCLESLTMKISYDLYNPLPIEELPEGVRSVFLNAPRLQRVVLRHAYGPSDFIFPLHITHLATFMGTLSNIETYQSLVECHLAIEDDFPEVSPSHPIHLPNVRRLFVSLPHMLPWLRLPLLNDLTILNVPGFELRGDDVSMINEFVYRSRCTLTRLAIYSPISHNPFFINDCLVSMDSLVSL